MTPQEIAEVRPRLLDFAAEMLGGLPRKDQRAAGELYVRGLLTGGRRKSMQPMAARLGTDHQRLQQFITSSAWDYVAARRNVTRWFAASQPVEALVVDDTGFPKDGTASPCVARQYSGTLGKVANCQIAVSVHLACEHASCAADRRLFCPQSWDDAKLDDPAQAARAARRRERAGIPDQVRHTEKWRLALEMIDEMTGPGGWDVRDQVTAAGGARPPAHLDLKRAVPAPELRFQGQLHQRPHRAVRAQDRVRQLEQRVRPRRQAPEKPLPELPQRPERRIPRKDWQPGTRARQGNIHGRFLSLRMCRNTKSEGNGRLACGSRIYKRITPTSGDMSRI